MESRRLMRGVTGRRPRRTAAWLATPLLAVAGLSVAPVGAAAVHPVSVTIATPMPDQSFPAPPISLSGSAASSAAGITRAYYTVQDRYSGQYQHANGAWGSYQALPLALGSPGVTPTAWSGSDARISSGDFNFCVTSIDALGNRGGACQHLSIAPSNPSGPGYLTIQWGRTLWSTADSSCQTVPGSLTLLQVAQDMRARGLTGTGTVVVDRTNETARTCLNGDLYTSWADLASLRDAYGWSFVSDGLTHGNITTMTPAQQQQESCGSLPALTGHGHSRASGLFAYGDNRYTQAIQANVVSTCFAYGRTYQGGRNIRSQMKAPWFQRSTSVLGGNCADSSAGCHTAISKKVYYADPQQIADLFNVPGDEWVDVQFYRLVTGVSASSKTWSWDCTSPDWRQHWTSQTELYCQDDFDWALAQVPAGVVVTDPGSVAQAWGRP